VQQLIESIIKKVTLITNSVRRLAFVNLYLCYTTRPICSHSYTMINIPNMITLFFAIMFVMYTADNRTSSWVYINVSYFAYNHSYCHGL